MMVAALGLLAFLTVANALHFGENGPRNRAFETSIILTDDFDDFIEKQLKDWHVPGLSLAVIDLELGVTEGKGYGYAILPDTKATVDSLYFTGSTTKAFTAAAAARIVSDADNFPDRQYPFTSWKTPLIDLLPDFALSNEYSTFHTTLEDALSHRSGLPRHDFAYGWNNASLNDIVRSLRHLPMSAEPRTRWQYCNTMFATVGAAIEKLTGHSLASYLRAYIWGPLSMKSTTFSLEEAKDLDQSDTNNTLARGYWFVNEGDCGGWSNMHSTSTNSGEDKCYYIPDPYMNITSLAGAGATISSVRDYSLWIEALLGMGKAQSWLYQQVLTPRTIMQADSRMLPPNQFMNPEHYALGWVSRWVGPYLFVYHGGGVPGFGTMLFLLPEQGLGFISMGNTQETSTMAALFIFEELLKKRMGHREASTLFSDFVADLKQDLPDFSLLKSQSKVNAVKKMRQRSSSISSIHAPIPGDIDDLVGIYEHPAYGNLNITIHKSESSASGTGRSTNEQIPLTPSQHNVKSTSLLVTPSPRLWNWVAILGPSISTYHYMDATLYMPHGPYMSDAVDFSDRQGCTKSKRTEGERWLDCKNEIVWDVVDGNRAAFEYGLDGKVDRLGLELEDELVRQAYEDGGDENWREGMIWFSKIY